MDVQVQSPLLSLTIDNLVQTQSQLVESISKLQNSAHDPTLIDKLSKLNLLAKSVEEELRVQQKQVETLDTLDIDAKGTLLSLLKDRDVINEMVTSTKEAREHAILKRHQLEEEKILLTETVNHIREGASNLINRTTKLEKRWTNVFNYITSAINQRHHLLATSNEDLRKEINKEVLSFAKNTSKILSIGKILEYAKFFIFSYRENVETIINEKKHEQTNKVVFLISEQSADLATLVKEIRKTEITCMVKGEKRDPKLLLPSQNILDQLLLLERSPVLTKEEWKKSLDNEGKITNLSDIKKRIFSGGVDSTIKSKVWRFVFNFYPWESTKSERKHIKQLKRAEYVSLKSQWESIDEEQAANFDDWLIRRDFIEKAASQTKFEFIDNTVDNMSKLKILKNVLYSYCFYNWNLGYSTGMNELLLPFLWVYNDEVDIFWCFKGLMDKVSHNFNYKKKGLLTTIFKLSRLINLMDPWFYAFLARTQSLHLLYCVRWIQVGFIEAFSPDQIILLWDSLWIDYPKEDFILFFIFGILLQCRDKIIVYHGEAWPYETIMQEISMLSKQMNLVKCLKVATALLHNFTEMGESLQLEESMQSIKNSEEDVTTTSSFV